MKICILMGSPRQDGNTASLVKPFIDEIKKYGADVSCIDLHEKTIKPCIACRECQNTSGAFGCPQEDDMQSIFNTVLESDLFVLATPIYSWYCTPPMKAALDRLVYGMNKYYGNLKERECLWKNKKCAIIATCGYPIEIGSEIFKDGIKRYCKHSKLNFVGIVTEQDKGYNKKFMDEEKYTRIKNFAKELVTAD